MKKSLPLTAAAVTVCAVLGSVASRDVDSSWYRALDRERHPQRRLELDLFKAHKLGPAVAVAGALTLSSVDLVRRTWAANERVGLALTPYPAWCGFATVLSAALWRRNR